MSLEQRLTQALQHVADEVEAPLLDVDTLRSRARRTRRRTVSGFALAAAAAMVLTGAALWEGRVLSAPEPQPASPPGAVVSAGAVWYDAAGLHHGNVVEKTPVKLLAAWEGKGVGYAGGGVLALVRHGAVYRDPATDDVWFHPWGGQARVIGRGSATGPGADAEGEVAAWFEGNELVVYDTARGRQLSRTRQVPGARFSSTEHVDGASPFTHVSGEEVVWRTESQAVHRFDVPTSTSSILWEVPPSTRDLPDPRPIDVQGSTWVWGDLPSSVGDRNGRPEAAILISKDGRQQHRLSALEPFGRLNADSAFLLSTTASPHGAAIVNVRTGDIWSFPRTNMGGSLAWSYGEIALAKRSYRADDPLVACHAITHVCETLPHRGTVLLPTS